MQLFSEDELICFLEAESGLIWFDLPRDFHEPMTSSNVHRMFMPNSGQFIPEVPTFWNPKQTHVLGIVSFFVFFFFFLFPPTFLLPLPTSPTSALNGSAQFGKHHEATHVRTYTKPLGAVLQGQQCYVTCDPSEHVCPALWLR